MKSVIASGFALALFCAGASAQALAPLPFLPTMDPLPQLPLPKLPGLPVSAPVGTLMAAIDPIRKPITSQLPPVVAVSYPVLLDAGQALVAPFANSAPLLEVPVVGSLLIRQ